MKDKIELANEGCITDTQSEVRSLLSEVLPLSADNRESPLRDCLGLTLHPELCDLVTFFCNLDQLYVGDSSESCVQQECISKE